MMKNFLVMILVSALFVSGCASGAVNRVYRINSSGFAEVDKGRVENAKKLALVSARQNLLSNVANFLEYKFHIDPQMEKEILYLSKAGQRGMHKNYYYINLHYDLNLYDFIAKHGDFRNIYCWELIGLESYYSDYMNSNKPIGIWAKDELFKAKKTDSTLIYAASALPVYSGNFFLNKTMMGGFFTAAKVLALLSALLNPPHEQELRNWSWAGLGVLTGLDVLSVYYEKNARSTRIQFLQDAILSKGMNLKFNVYNNNF